jgi:hypothetical protein
MLNRRQLLGGHWGKLKTGQPLFHRSRVWRSAQYNVMAKMQKAAAIMATTIMSVGIG